MTTAIGFKQAFSRSLTLHVFLVLGLFVTIFLAPHQQPPVQLDLKQSDKIVQATTVNASAVDAEVKRIQNEEAVKATLALKQTQALKQAAAQAAKLKAQQEVALAKLKQEQADAIKAQQAQLVAIQKQQNQAKQALNQIQTATAQAQQQQASLKKQQLEQAVALKAQAQKALDNQLNQEATQLNQAKQKQINSELAKYTELIRQAIAQQWIIPPNAIRSAYCILTIQLMPDGTVTSVQIKQSSGDPVLDRSAVTAVNKASPLPVPSDPALFKLMQEINLRVQPDALS